MPEDAENTETDTFTQNENVNSHKSKSYMDLRDKNKVMKIGLIVLILITVVLIVAVIVITVVKFRMGKDDDHAVDPEVCRTAKCVETAKYLYQNMDLSVDPCEDFYNYTCRRWGIHNPRPVDKEVWGVNTLVQTNLNNQILEILEGTDKVLLSLQKARNFFRACINTEFRDEYGLEALHKLFKKVGGFPMITENWDEASFDWQKAYVYIDTQINAVPLFFSYSVSRQLDEEKVQNIEIEALDSFYVGDSLIDEELKQEEKFEKEKEFKESLKEYLTDLKGYIVDDETLESDMNTFIDFEKKLATLVVQSAVEDEDNDTEILTIKEMQEQYKDIDWLKLFGDIFMTVNINITNEELVYNSNPTFFKKLGAFLNETSKRYEIDFTDMLANVQKTLANYICFNIVTEFGKKAIYNWEEDDDKQVDKKALRISCGMDTERFFSVALNYWYVKTVLGKEAMCDLEGFIKTIKEALTLTINTNKWMQEKTKQAAQMKLNKMLNYIASPAEIKSDDQLDEFYKQTGYISNENYVYDYKKMSKWAKHGELTKLRETSDTDIEVPSEVNSYYSPYDNKIQILTGFLSPPNFYPGAPLAINIPAIGSTIGHEITHGFDDTGSQYDAKGIKRNWWDKKTQKQYKSKVNCFIEQYSEYIEPKTGKPINGKLTVGENIADNGAIHQTFTAYKIHAALKHPEKDLKLPNEMSRFTKDQQFFISYANTYCGDHAKSWMYEQLKDEHAPDDARVIVPLQNSEAFSRAFNCKKGAAMNPVKKCILW